MIKHFLLFLVLFLSSPVFASHEFLEKEYQKHWCKLNNGITEYRLSDSTRVDCLTEDYAVEFDFAYKWAESIGQSLYYSNCTGKKPGIVLILEKPAKDEKYLKRLNSVAQKHNIKVWTITPDDIPLKKRTCQK